jgi:hypothetical protein
MMPNNMPGALPAGSPFHLPTVQQQRGASGALFYAACLKVGVIDCDCEVCKIVKRLAKAMLTEVEALLDAPDG